jgi:hypothetical protein
VIGWLDSSGRERNAQPGAFHEGMAAGLPRCAAAIGLARTLAEKR